MSTRYNTDHLVEAQFEPGSRGRVLKNLLGIRGKRQMDALEAVRLEAATDWAIRHVTADQRFTAADICRLHRQWLGELYPCAGDYRQVNISKGSFVFVMAAQVPRLMRELERDVLARYTPCAFGNRVEVLEALAITHCELMLIHPSREGNGRFSRLLSTLMALQAGLPLLNFFRHQGKTACSLFRRSTGRHGAQLHAGSGNLSQGGCRQHLAFLCGELAGSGRERAFSRLFYALDSRRGKHVGTQGPLVVLRVAQVRVLLDEGFRCHGRTIRELFDLFNSMSALWITKPLIQRRIVGNFIDVAIWVGLELSSVAQFDSNH